MNRTANCLHGSNKRVQLDQRRAAPIAQPVGRLACGPDSLERTLHMGARSYVVIVSASILVSLVLAAAAAAAPPADSTDFADDPFLLESDYTWTDTSGGYTTFDGEPGTPSNPNPNDPDSDCDPEGMRATSWWQIHGTGRHTFITTALEDTDYDTVMAVYEEGANNTIGDYVGCNDDIANNDRRSEVALDPSDSSKDYWVQVGGFQGATGTLEIAASSDAPGNDARAQAAPINIGPQTFWENFGATPVGPNENCDAQGGGSLGKTVWFRYTTPERGNLSVDVTGFFNIIVGVYRGNQATALGCGNNFGTTTAHAAGGDQDADTYFIQVGAADDDDDYFAQNFDADEADFGLEIRFTPDTDDDDDGVGDSQDRCPLQKGSGLSRDCPDPDSDTFADSIDDRCPGVGGNDASKYQGCPDNDRDGVPEGPGGDACPGQNPRQLGRRDSNTDGCPDTLALHKNVKLSRSVVFAPGGIRLLSFAVTGVPSGATVIISCRLPSGRKCGGVRVRRASTGAQAAAKTIRPKNLQGKRLPFGAKITTRVTAKYATGSFIRFTAARNSRGFRETYFCMNRGSKKLKRRGCR